MENRVCKLVPRKRGGFSDRNNLKKVNDLIQIDTFDDRIRNRIYNLYDYILNEFLINTCERDYNHCDIRFIQFIYETIFVEILPIKHTKLSYRIKEYKNKILDLILTWEPCDILSFLEGTAVFLEEEGYTNFTQEINEVFVSEVVGYRFVDKYITKITSNIEINSIEKAINNPYKEIGFHMEKATLLLYNREAPDYKNSIKESISAIEAICNIIVDKKNVTLGKALKLINKESNIIHPALEEGFLKIYGYTSDKSGIRHSSGLSENTTFEEAEFILVACSAFINYLTSIKALNDGKM